MFQKNEIQISYFAGNRNVYDDYISFLLKQHNYESAFNEIEIARSRNMLQNLNHLKFSDLINDEKTLNNIYQRRRRWSSTRPRAPSGRPCSRTCPQARFPWRR